MHQGSPGFLHEQCPDLLEQDDGSIGRFHRRFALASSMSVTIVSRFLPDRIARALNCSPSARRNSRVRTSCGIGLFGDPGGGGVRVWQITSR